MKGHWLVVLALVACGGKDDSAETDGPGTTPPPPADADADTDTDADSDTDTDTDTDSDADGDVDQAAAAGLSAQFPGDTLGSAVAGAGDVDGDGLRDLIVGASGVTSSSGAAFFLASPFTSGLVNSVATNTWLGPTPAERTGEAVAGGLDGDGDGRADMVVGAWLIGGGQGGVYMMSSTAVTSPNLGSPILGAAASDYFGASLAMAATSGDAAVFVGAYGSDLAGPQSGTVYVLPFTATNQNQATARLNGGVYDKLFGHGVGWNVAAGDLDGDGLDDLVTGAPDQYKDGIIDTGAVYLALAPFSGDLAIADVATLIVDGVGKQNRVGEAIATGGDIDGDGLDDALIGTPNINGGTAWWVKGTATGRMTIGDAAFSGFVDGDDVSRLGAGVGLEDMNGDGLADLLVAAPDNEDLPHVAVFYGPAEGALDLEADVDKRLAGQASSDFGLQIGALGDTDGDGKGDVAVGAPLGDYVSIFLGE